MKNFIKTILGYIIIFICKIFNQFIKFKFFQLYSSRVGHLTLNFDAALLSVPKNTFIIFFLLNSVANSFILKFFKKQKKVFFVKSIFFSRIFSCVHSANPHSDLLLSFKKVQPEFSFQFKHKSKINFPHYSEEKLETIFLKYGLKRNFVGLHARNNLYYKNNNLLNDKNYHGFRNFDFKDYRLAIMHLKKKYSIVKLGVSYQEENIDYLNKYFETKIFTSFDFNFNHEIDFLINAYSRYNVVASSGIDAISSILRKKIVYVNLIPFNFNRLSYCSPNSIILPKKLFDKKKNRILTLKENLNISFSIHTSSDPYKKHQLEVINNTQEEIMNAVIEMEEKIEGKDQFEVKKLNDTFWKSVGDENYDKINYLKNTLKLSISSSFLKNSINFDN
jgi:putative glycosyltransferase (TIGR04372 family)